MSKKNEKETANDNPKEGVRDLDMREDFDAATGEVTNSEMAAHYDAEREKLLGVPVGTGGSAVAAYPTAPVTIEKADASEKAVINKGDSADVLAKKYSGKQLTDLAADLGIAQGRKASKLSFAVDILKAHEDRLEAAGGDGQTALNTLPAAPELHPEADKDAMGNAVEKGN